MKFYSAVFKTLIFTLFLLGISMLVPRGLKAEVCHFNDPSWPDPYDPDGPCLPVENSQCPCSNPGNTGWCASNNVCQFTCVGSCSCESTGLNCHYGGWSDCTDCYMTRRCDTPASSGCDENMYQIQYCCGT